MVTIDKLSCQTLRDEINAALAAVAARHNISISAGSCTYTANNATFKLAVAVRNASGVVESKERTDFKPTTRGRLRRATGLALPLGWRRRSCAVSWSSARS